MENSNARRSGSISHRIKKEPSPRIKLCKSEFLLLRLMEFKMIGFYYETLQEHYLCCLEALEDGLLNRKKSDIHPYYRPKRIFTINMKNRKDDLKLPLEISCFGNVLDSLLKKGFVLKDFRGKYVVNTKA
jgi:hypothetical protein